MGAGASPRRCKGPADGQWRHLEVEAGAFLAVQAGHDERQRDDAGDAGSGQVQLLGQVERRVHLAVGEGREGPQGALEHRLVSRASRGALCSDLLLAFTHFPAGKGVLASPGAFPTLMPQQLSNSESWGYPTTGGWEARWQSWALPPQPRTHVPKPCHAPQAQRPGLGGPGTSGPRRRAWLAAAQC